MIDVGNVASSSHIVDKKNWNTIWFMKIPSKVKKFLWKIYVDVIPCCYELWKKKIRKNPNCPVCRKRSETIEHVMFCVNGLREYGFVHF